MPDRILFPGPLFIEFKRKGGKPTAIQEHVHEQLRERGAHVYVIDDFDDFKALFL